MILVNNTSHALNICWLILIKTIFLDAIKKKKKLKFADYPEMGHGQEHYRHHKMPNQKYKTSNGETFTKYRVTLCPSIW